MNPSQFAAFLFRSNTAFLQKMILPTASNQMSDSALIRSVNQELTVRAEWPTIPRYAPA